MDQDSKRPTGKEKHQVVRPNPPADSDEAVDKPLFDQPDHSMLDEEPDGWDQAPTDIHDPKMKRHSRKEGKGGTPDPGDKRPRID